MLDSLVKKLASPHFVPLTVSGPWFFRYLKDRGGGVDSPPPPPLQFNWILVGRTLYMHVCYHETFLKRCPVLREIIWKDLKISFCISSKIPCALFPLFWYPTIHFYIFTLYKKNIKLFFYWMSQKCWGGENKIFLEKNFIGLSATKSWKKFQVWVIWRLFK